MSLNSQILATKLVIPTGATDIVQRPRLAAMMEVGKLKRLTLLCAAPGYGKTTFMANWIQHSGRPAAWMSIDNGDNDPTRFLSHVIAAIQRTYPDFGSVIAKALQATQLPPLISLMTPFINQVLAIPESFSLILDDYHLIEEKQIHQAMEFLIENQPPNLHLAFTSRTDPPFSLSRLRSRGQLAEFRAEDLRFTRVEAQEFLTRVMGIDLTEAEVAALESRTEGWVAGLQLAALSLHNNPDKAGFIRSFAGDDRHIMDFLVDEVLARQSEDVKSFLLRTSILERFNADLCEALTGRVDSANMLEHLENANMFMVALDRSRAWYRYHHLFANLLQKKLQQVSGQLFRDLHQVACRWFSDNGLTIEAVHHALCIDDYELVANLIEQRGYLLMSQGKVKTVLSWVQQLPENVIEARPVLALLCAWVHYFTSDPVPVERYVSIVERALKVDERDDFNLGERIMLGHVALIRSYQTRYAGSIDKAIEWVTRAGELIPQDHISYPAVCVNQAICHFVRGEYIEAQKLFGRYASTAHPQHTLLVITTCIFGLSRIKWMQGKLREADKILRTALTEYQAKGWENMPITGGLYLAIADLEREWNQIDAAQENLNRGLELTSSGGMDFSNGWGLLVEAQLRIARQDGSEILDPQREDSLSRFWGRISNDITRIAILLTRIWLAQGRLTEIRLWIEASDIDATRQTPDREPEQVLLGRLLIAEGRHEEAVELLSSLLLNAESGKRGGVVIEILVLLALARQALGQTRPAVASLQRALILAEPEGYVRMFIDEGAPMAALLQRVAEAGEGQAYAAKLLEAMRQTPAAQTSGKTLAVPLSGKEIRVAQYLVAGLSNQEIADKMHISLNTVKTHLKNIYGKLDVDHRVEAVERIRDLNLLA